MSQNSPHKDVLEPLRQVEEEVNKKVDELKELAKGTQVEINEFDETSLEGVKKAVLNIQVQKAEEKMREYAQEIKTDPERLKINESELYQTLTAAIIAGGGTEEDLPYYLNMLGMKPAKSASELFDLDANFKVDEAEMLEVTHNKEADPQTGLNSLVTSVFNDYQEDMRKENVTTKDGLRTVLLSKMPRALELLNRKYTSTKKGEKRLADIEPERGMGKQISNLFSLKPNEQTELDIFYNALFGGKIDEKPLLDNGRLNKIRATELFSQKIEQICGEFDESLASQYQEMIKVPKWGTPESNKKMFDLLESVPEEFQGGPFEKKYEKYAEDSIKKDNCVPKGFQEWLSKRPKPSGIGGVIDTIQLLFAQSGLGKLLKDFFGKDSWIGRILGLSDEKEKKMNEEEKQKMDEAGVKNPTAWEYKKDIAKMESLQKNPKWGEVLIEGITKENVGEFPKEIDAITSILNSQEETMDIARKKGLTLDTLKKLDGMSASLVLVTGKELFTLKGDKDKKEYTINNEGIGAASSVVESIDENAEELDQILGEHSGKFSLTDQFPINTLFTDSNDKRFATLQPALQSLLGLNSKFWDVEISDTYMKRFLDNMGGNMGWVSTGKFRNVDNAFQESGDLFEAKEGMFSSNTKYKTVKEFFEKLQ